MDKIDPLYAYLVARGDTPVLVNPVPRGLSTRRQGGSRRSQIVPLVRVPRTLPRILPPGEADRLVGALRTHRDRAMVLAMLLAGLRRCEVLGLRFADVQIADRRLAVVEGKGGHHRIVPVANRFGFYLHDERPETARTDRVFVVLKGPRRGLPLMRPSSTRRMLAGVINQPPAEHADGPTGGTRLTIMPHGRAQPIVPGHRAGPVLASNRRSRDHAASRSLPAGRRTAGT